MNHHLDERQLNDCADGMLSVTDASRAEMHLSACAACRNRVAALRQLRTELAALPLDIVPPPHVLSGMRARIAAADPASGVRAWYARPRLLAAAAVLLVALSSGVTALLLRPPADSPSSVGASPAGTTALVAVHAMERSYEEAIAEVQRALAEQQSGLAPATLRVLQTNLEIIDRAVAEARTALHADPANDALAELLRSGYERKLDVLRSARQHARARS